jgi:hypothetical protein
MENISIMKIEQAKVNGTSIKAETKKIQGKNKEKMRNITINIPENYDYNIQKLIKMKLTPSRSEAIRTALREFLNKEYNKNLELLNYFNFDEELVK